ncbi:MAG: site-2 protease family protein [Kiritimatiellae bacterium]|nr:site-2 protease family protein [Kiritimatiellia bacterium]
MKAVLKEGDAFFNLLKVLTVTIGAFTSIALHELGHSYVAIKKNCRVRQITLMFIGGAAEMEEIPRKPADELQMAIAGPAVSLVLGLAGFFGGLYLWRSHNLLIYETAQLIFTLGILNFFLAGFNLLPSFPMDGGRVLRALLTPKLGRLRATAIAAKLGRTMAILFGIAGFFGIRSFTSPEAWLVPPHDWFLITIAFFIYSAAGAEYRMIQMQEAANNQGFGFKSWSPFTSQEQPPENNINEQVSVSPPPYRHDPNSTTDIHQD